MKFAFFTLGGYFFWEDIYNYQGWVIQHNVRNSKYRLLDKHNICRDSGTFEQCKTTLLKYIDAYELQPPYQDTVIILHGFAHTKKSLAKLCESLSELPANIVPLNYPSLRKGLKYHAKMLDQLIENLDIKGNLYIINVGTSCLITRQMIHNNANYRSYNIAGVLDINPSNSGSDLAELLTDKKIFNFILGPMLRDISTPRAVRLPRLPADINHGIIFSSGILRRTLKKHLAKFESITFDAPPTERSYAEKIKDLETSFLFSLKNQELFDECKTFLTTGDFSDQE